MEKSPIATISTTESRDEKMTCWHMATSPQCLRVETISEVHLFPYGYFSHARFSCAGNIDTIEIKFQETTVIAKGKGLEPLCNALARLGVERIKTCPEKYGAGTKEGIITEIEVRQNRKDNLAA